MKIQYSTFALHIAWMDKLSFRDREPLEIQIMCVTTNSELLY